MYFPTAYFSQRLAWLPCSRVASVRQRGGSGSMRLGGTGRWTDTLRLDPKIISNPCMDSHTDTKTFWYTNDHTLIT